MITFLKLGSKFKQKLGGTAILSPYCKLFRLFQYMYFFPLCGPQRMRRAIISAKEDLREGIILGRVPCKAYLCHRKIEVYNSLSV